MLFPKVNKIENSYKCNVTHDEQKLCCTFNNCSVCDRLNLRKSLAVLSCCLCILYKIGRETRIFLEFTFDKALKTFVEFRIC